mmetsp:Transcript_13573/g.29514  ORF Transcript_13573/g.29514 Transcript_13573/m.29514 type:complete len:291 (+) Transcript_13573:58-930(+)|eukprot:CAMPEP_0172310054 /NCGR_PEP_ID=MMETSP1058-20130122/11225_1 /TAXON_ID=83371 /ORGANISM="Detonula confervacea, Strain CCMP 353" /LENGTH=290 /DNA_ID=CAMNT_0013022815 /DNA_START=25 /DNA_END=897 /DNA_ORIENTATION=+
MRSILSLGLTALAASTSAVSAETTIAILEFGPGGAVHRTTSTFTESNSAAIASFWNTLHRPSKRSSMSKHAGMSVVPDLFTSADAGIVIGLKGESLESMPIAASLLDAGASVDNVVGHVHVRGQVGAALMKRAASSKEDVAVIAKEDIGRRLQSTAETAARGAQKGMEALSLAVDSDEAAAVADEQLGRMLETLKKEAMANGKTVIVHLVVEEPTRRRLEDNNENGENQNNNNNAYSNEKSMYQIQTFNLYLWTAVGLFVIVYMVLSMFIAMPLFPDTLLFAEAAKIGSD